MSDMQHQYQDSSKLLARAMIHIKYGPPGKAFSVADTGLIGAGARVLDIGCGPGRFWATNAAVLPPDIDLTLADQSAGMVDEAIKTVTAANGKWRAVAGKVADVCALPFANASFDVVTAMHMLYHAADIDRAAAEIARVLAPGGVLIATTNSDASMAELNALSLAVFGPVLGGVPHIGFNLENGAAILQPHFREVTVHTQMDILRVTDAQDVVNYLRSFPPGDEADDTTLQKLGSELAARMAAQDGVFPITRTAGYLVGGPRQNQ